MDILYLTHNRLEFTKASMAALIKNTNWTQVSKLLIYDDASIDGSQEYLQGLDYPVPTEFRFGAYGSPVAAMNHYISGLDAMQDRVFAKIDNDTMVPERWLDECLRVMSQELDNDLLGIEAMRKAVPGRVIRGCEPAEFIGGIGLMRNRAFITLPRPSGRYGFTAWQSKSSWVKKGWLTPSLPVFLLDRIPREPWRTLAKEYVAKGWQREWPPYNEKDVALWSWFCQ